MSALQWENESSTYYKLDDFEKVIKIDAHLHINTEGKQLLSQAEKDNFKLITINVDYSDFPKIEIQNEIAKKLSKEYPQRLAFAATFHMDGWDEPEWRHKTIEAIDERIKEGASAIKVWKNIGMDFRDKSGKLVMIDDPGLDPIFNHIKKREIPVIGHLGEPRNCWLPLEEMTVDYDREYFKHHPQYHMYLHPELPSYEDQINARDNMLMKHKDLTFVGAHLASLEWSVRKISEFLTRFPNAVVDTAARIGPLQYQSIIDRELVRNFFIKFQDRILYATDIMQMSDEGAEAFVVDSHNLWLNDWKYFCTDLEFNVPDLKETVKGLKLPKDVIDKIYRFNAEKIFPKIKNN